MHDFIQEILLLLNEGCGNFYINVDGESVWDTKEYTEHGYTTITSRMCGDAEHIEIFDDFDSIKYYHRYWIEGIENFKCKADGMEIQINFEVKLDNLPNQKVEIRLTNLSGGGSM